MPGAARDGRRGRAPLRARKLIEEGARQALQDLEAVPPYDPGRPCEILVEFKTTVTPQELAYRHGVEVLEPRKVVSRGDDWWSAWRQFFF